MVQSIHNKIVLNELNIASQLIIFLAMLPIMLVYIARKISKRFKKNE